MYTVSCDSSSMLEKMNDDVLLLVVSLLGKANFWDLRRLSLVSKRLRSLCLPTLFEKASIHRGRLLESDPPPASWPYIREMVFSGSFKSYFQYDGAGHLPDIIPHLVALRKVQFCYIPGGVHWYDLQLVIAAPNVRALEIQDFAGSQHEDISIPEYTSLANLPFTEFIYTIDDPPDLDWYSFDPPGPRNRRCYMNTVVLSLHEKLEVLHLPIAIAPLQDMATMNWPCLRELKLYSGEYISNDRAIFARLCARMPRLRVLDLQFLHIGPSTQTLIWTSDLTFAPSLEHLQRVYIPYPDASDLFYAHLPSTLQSLRLVDRPRYYHFKGGRLSIVNHYPRPTLVTAAALVGILSRLQGTFTSLQHLELAFQADSQDIDLSCRIAAIFPSLHVLELHRYRSEGETGVDIERSLKSIAQNLSTIRTLRHLRIYLNLPDDDYRSPLPAGHQYETPVVTKQDFIDSLGHYAALISQICSPALQIVDILTTWIFGAHIWIRWYISRDDAGRPTVKLHDPSFYLPRYRDEFP
ncbi:hypothetical protein DENSPDRAFT_663916 [Dentipellis sp. KUC8613]|nr:hypothetical protein DENSPDRAFT_663916 [Dentipellis sp. KUC8613]